MVMGTARHSRLIPATILIGALTMLLSDVLSQLPGSERILPINAVTSLLGIPVVVWLILKNKNIGYL
jgi:iron complex transport system permease protein